MVLVQDRPRQLFSIGAVCRMKGVECSPTTLREMEADGLIPPPARVEGFNLRLYSPEDVEAIRRARAARTAGSAERAAV
jgi:DNA-binding transcriptional MerR regulator